MFAQKDGQALIDSMINVLPTHVKDLNKVNFLNKISFAFSDYDTKSEI